MLTRFLNDNTAGMKLARTIVQGLIGVLIANADVLIGTLTIAPEYKPVIVAGVMAVLAPCMALMNTTDTLDLNEIANDLGEPDEPTIND